MKLSWELIGLALLALFVLFAGASQASSIGSFTEEKRIDIISQTGILDTNLTYTFKELNDTHWIANFCVKPTTSAVFNPAIYNLTALTSGISFEQASPIRFDTGSKCGWFYLIFPKGFKENEQAQFGSGTTVINTATTIPFYPNQRAVCRDGTGIVHVAWSYSTTTVAYANSTDNGATWRLSYTIVNGTGTKNTPSISCDGNNITVAYINGSANIAVFNSANNGAAFTDISPTSATVGNTRNEVDVERRGQRIYLVYGNSTTATGRASIIFLNSTDAGATWGAKKSIFTGSYTKVGSLPAYYTEYYHPTLAVNGTGGATDIIHVAAQEDDVDTESTIYFGIYYVNSSNSGSAWPSTPYTIITDTGTFYNYPSITFLGVNLYVAFYRGAASSTVIFANSTNNGASWTTPYQISVGAVTTQYPSVAMNDNSLPCVFWVNGTTYKDIAYRGLNSSVWDAVYYSTTDGLNNTYVNTRYNYYSSGIDVLWTNGSTATKSITYSLMNCTYTEAGGAPPAEEYHPVMDIGDPLYCSIPPLVLDSNIEILCHPKSNTTGQPLTGMTVNCQANANGLYTAGAQAATAAGERAAGVYNWTLLASNIAPSTCYTVNCSTAINTVVNGFAGAFCVMPDFATSCASTAEVYAVGSNVTSTNTTCTTANTNIIAVGSNLTDVNTTIVTLLRQLGVNITSVNNTILLVGINTTSLNASIFMVGSNLTEHNQTIYNLISLLEDLTAQGVWEYPARDANCTNCSEGGGITLEELATVNDTVKAGWGYTNRSSEIANATWNATNRSLTHYETGETNLLDAVVSANDTVKAGWGYTNRSSEIANATWNATNRSLTHYETGETNLNLSQSNIIMSNFDTTAIAIVFCVIALGFFFVYVGVNLQEEQQAFKIGFFILSFVCIYSALVITSELTSAGGQQIIGTEYNPDTGITNFTYGQVSNLTTARGITLSLLDPLKYVMFLFISYIIVMLIIAIGNRFFG